MKRFDHIAENIQTDFSFYGFPDLRKLLFVDIETTGLKASSSRIYLIGCSYYQEDSWHITQWLAQDSSEEPVILRSFLEMAASYSVLIHFNGTTFDLPFLSARCMRLGIPWTLKDRESFDLYQKLLPRKLLFSIPDCRQKTLERFLGLEREDRYTGGELIEIYHEYSHSGQTDLEDLLTLHNLEDMEGMLLLPRLLSYEQALKGAVNVTKARANRYTGYDGEPMMELIISCTLSCEVPREVSLQRNRCYLHMQDDRADLKVPVREGELKFFYPNPKEYYYLPSEDMAIHKSVATFVDHGNRVQATPANCYIKKTSCFLPQWSAEFEPCFRADHQSKEYYFELTDSFKNDREAFNRYISYVFQTLFLKKKPL